MENLATELNKLSIEDSDLHAIYTYSTTKKVETYQN